MAAPTPEEQLRQLDEARAQAVVNRMTSNETRMNTMLERQQEMLVNFYRATTEQGRESIKADMQNRQEQLAQQLSDMKRNYLLYSKFMTKAERRTFQEMYNAAEQGMADISKQMSNRFGDMQDDVEELSETFSERIDRISNELREIGDSLNLSALAQSIEETVDSYVQNLRQIRTVTNDTFDEKRYGELIDQVNLQVGALNRSETSEVAQRMVKDFGIRNADEITDYLQDMASAEVMGWSSDDLKDIMWKDMDQGAHGRMFRNINNMAMVMSETDGLYTDATAILGAIASNIDEIYGLTAKDSKGQTKMISSLAALQALQEASANSGVTNMTEMLTDWSKKIDLELYDDERFLSFSNLTGISAQDLISAFRGEGDFDIVDVANRYQQAIQSMNDQQLYVWKDMLGFDSVAQMKELQLADLEALSTAFDTAQESIGVDENGNADILAENNQQALLDNANQAVGYLETIKNELTSWGPVKAIADTMGSLDISLADIGGFITIGSTLLKGGSKLFSFLGKEGGLLSKLGGLFSGGGGFLSSLKSLFTGGTNGPGLFGHIRNLFSGGAGTGGAGGPGLIASLKSALSGLTASGGLFEGISATSWGTGLGSTIASTVAPLGGAALALKDAVGGFQKSTEWLGEEEGNLVSGKVSSMIGGALGGTSSGLSGALGGAAKGALIGAVAGPIGSAIGGLIGGVAGYIGGEKITKAIQGTWNFIKDCGAAAFDAVGEGVAAVSGVLQQLGPIGGEMANVLNNSWSAVTETKDKIAEIWADPDKGLPGKIFGTIGAFWSGAGKVAESVISGVKNIAGMAWDGIKNIAGKAWDGIKSFAKNTWEGAKKFAKDAWNTAKKVAGEVWDGISKVAGDVWKGLQDGVKSFAEAGATLLRGAGDFAAGLGTGIGNAAQGVGIGAGATLAGAGTGVGVIIEGIGEGAGSFFNGVISGIGSAVGDSLSGLGDALTGFGETLSGLGDTISGIGAAGGSLLEGGGKGGAAIIDSLTGGKGILGAAGDFLNSGKKFLFGGSSEVDLSNLELTGDPILDRLDIMTAYLKAISENGGAGGGKEDKGVVGEAVDVGKDVISSVYEGGKQVVSDIYNGGKQVASDVAGAVSTGADWVADKAKGAWDFMTGWIPSFDEGSSNISNDGLAFLHEGEAVLTKDQAQVVRGEADGGIPISNMLDEWAGKSKSELYDDERFLSFSNLTGMSADDILNKEKALGKYQDAIMSMNDIQLYAFKDRLGFDSVAQMKELGSADFNILEKALNTSKSALSPLARIFDPIKNAILNVFKGDKINGDTLLASDREQRKSNLMELESLSTSEMTQESVSSIYPIVGNIFATSTEFFQTLLKGFKDSGIIGTSPNGNSVFAKIFRGLTGADASDISTDQGGSFWSGITGFLGGRSGGNSGGSRGSGTSGGSGGAGGGGSYRTTPYTGEVKPISVSGGSNESTIWNFFKGKGLSDAGIAGIMGNFYAESAFNPTNLQNSYEKKYGSDSEYTANVDAGKQSFDSSSGGYGLAQWTYSTRKQGLLALAQQRGTSIGDLNTQLEYAWQELNSYGMVDTLKNATDVTSATNYVMTGFEKPADQSINSLNKRAGYGQDIFNKYAGVASYDVGTPWVEGDQVALIHDREMIVPADVNPLNPANATQSYDYPDEPEHDNSDVVDTLKWMVTRLEAKLDRLIQAQSSDRRRAPASSGDMDRAFSLNH